MAAADLLRVAGLSLGRPGLPPLVEDVDLTIGAGERCALLGASGAGKSLIALALVDLLPPPLQRLAGSVLLDGSDPATASAERLRELRGGVAGLAFQEPETALNPVFSIGFQLRDTIRAHRRGGRAEVDGWARELLRAVGLGPPCELLRAYPHQLSGGQLQRAMLALALAGRPRLLIADEPTSALDPITRREILELLERLCREQGLALLLVSHDLAAVHQLAERVVVLLAGEVVEETSAALLLRDPLHPFTRLLVALARSGSGAIAAAPDRNAAGCRFAPGCDLARRDCTTARPALAATADGRLVRCPFVAPRADG